MDRYFIPIIGTISAGKSTFLNAFLGINMLESGSLVTTRFVNIIKNNNEQDSFYHVVPKKEKGKISFVKDGEEIKEKEQIIKKIEEINDNFSKKQGKIDEIFYILETPIKNIQNKELLDNCYFMDIPGLNENEANYIDTIFSLITIENILFEIIIFDSTSIGGDNVLHIFQSLEKRNALVKKNNLYILNKIDLCTKDEENIIDSFSDYFYKSFEDQKNEKNNIIINKYDNKVIPMNSFLYLHETKLKKDFFSLLFLKYIIIRKKRIKKRILN